MDNIENSTGFVRLSGILAPRGPIPVSKSTWWAGVKSGRYPKTGETRAANHRLAHGRYSRAHCEAERMSRNRRADWRRIKGKYSLHHRRSGAGTQSPPQHVRNWLGAAACLL